jgi:transaldolase
MYVTELVVAGTVNTMPEKTLDAVADHGEITGDTVSGSYDSSRRVMSDLADQGISYDEVVETLEVEGVDKFEKSWAELVEGVESELAKARS